MAKFLGTTPGITDDIIKDYILTSQPKIIVGDVNAVRIGNNNIYESDHITTFSIQFDLVDDISSQQDLLDSGSQLFLNYSQAFCGDVSF